MMVALIGLLLIQIVANGIYFCSRIGEGDELDEIFSDYSMKPTLLGVAIWLFLTVFVWFVNAAYHSLHS